MTASKNILIVGATSAIAEAAARLWAAERAQLHLIARNSAKLALVSRDLETRGARVSAAELDVNRFDLHAPAIDAAFDALKRVDVVLIAHGDLPDQQLCEQSEQAALAAVHTNAASVVSLMTLIANRMQHQGSGVIAVLGSVAGDRGRKSNFVYGSCKALVATFMEGLAGRQQASGVREDSSWTAFVAENAAHDNVGVEHRPDHLFLRPGRVLMVLTASSTSRSMTVGWTLAFDRQTFRTFADSRSRRWERSSSCQSG
ncbi:MAG: SDR family NAD(P)-dependent oxidoreductase, partial [Steroidobacteraceae bacterium]